MAKKIQKTFYLEQMNMQFLEQYQEKYKLSSISVALNHVLFNLITVNENNYETKKEILKKEKKEEKKISTSILNLKNTMRD